MSNDRRNDEAPAAVATTDASQLPTCAQCGVAIGAYEPLRWIGPDGSVTTTGWLRARADPSHAHPASRFLHLECFRSGAQTALGAV